MYYRDKIDLHLLQPAEALAVGCIFITAHGVNRARKRVSHASDEVTGLANRLIFLAF